MENRNGELKWRWKMENLCGIVGNRKWEIEIEMEMEM